MAAEGINWDASDEDIANALLRHGYNPNLPPRGVAGGPGEFDGYKRADAGLKMFADNFVAIKLRNWVCALDGIGIDGHSDPDNSGLCIHCSEEL